MRVAYFSPLPPEPSGVAAHSALVLPALRRRVEVEVVPRGRRTAEADVALYHVGNDPRAHGWIVEALFARPGVVVLHEVALHELAAGLTLGRGDRDAYLDAVEREGGRRGRLLALGALDGMLPPLWELRPGEFPLLGPVLASATGVVVHSRDAEERVRASGYGGPVSRVPLAAAVPSEPVGPAKVEGLPLICTFGVLNRAKRIPQLLEAFARVRRRRPEAVLVLAGPGGEALQLEARAERAGLRLGRDVEYTGYVDERELDALLAAADVCVSLRWPTLGEASASALKVLAHGRPLVVSDVGWFSELPGSVVAKVPVDEHEVVYLAAVLDLLASDARLRERLGAAGREYAQREHDAEQTADGYVEALKRSLGAPELRAHG